MTSEFDNQSPDTEMNQIKRLLWAIIFWGAVSFFIFVLWWRANEYFEFVSLRTALFTGLAAGFSIFCTGIFTSIGRWIAERLFWFSRFVS